MKLLIFAGFIVSSLFLFSFRADVPASSKKKIDKTIAALWSGKDVKRESLVLTEAQKSKISFKVKDDQLYKLTLAGQVVGYLYLDAANGKFDKFDYMVIFKPDLSILTTQVLVYREEYGGEIGSERWLKQFNNKSGGNKMEFGKDIQNISGATISARSITSGIKKLSRNMSDLRTAGVL